MAKKRGAPKSAPAGEAATGDADDAEAISGEPSTAPPKKAARHVSTEPDDEEEGDEWAPILIRAQKSRF